MTLRVGEDLGHEVNFCYVFCASIVFRIPVYLRLPSRRLEQVANANIFGNQQSPLTMHCAVVRKIWC